MEKATVTRFIYNQHQDEIEELKEKRASTKADAELHLEAFLRSLDSKAWEPFISPTCACPTGRIAVYLDTKYVYLQISPKIKLPCDSVYADKVPGLAKLSTRYQESSKEFDNFSNKLDRMAADLHSFTKSLSLGQLKAKHNDLYQFLIEENPSLGEK